MALKDSILFRFEESADEYLSGEQLAEEFHVSRAAVWKAVKALKEEGYEIESSPSKGYCFSSENDILNAKIIEKLNPEEKAPVYVFETIDSTNNYAKILAAQNAPHGTLVIANHQSAGRGRQGHSFYSPASSGLYLSLIIHPSQSEYISRITPAAAVAAVRAIEETAGIRPGIKWVNDLFIEKKKIAGILSEAISDFETHTLSAVIIGIGINCRPMKFPDELEEVASSLNANKLSRNALAAALWKYLLFYTSHLEDPQLMELYRRDSIILNKEILYTQNNETFQAKVTGINDEGNLILEKPDGSVQVLASGEISVKDW
ncbi:MAG: biotin--[acetyl-CoA-carboxylase] ligase [Erysipelotrichaceae bacterium]|nr:biotin--[acetyl-CoA-carboxylase] ligase [Erysipelotrichaceae bacterium]